MIREVIKWLLFPGINLHARLRYRVLPRYLPPPESENATVLDAGCGNGMLTYQAYRKGYRSIGISIKSGEIKRNRQLFNEWLGIPESCLMFKELNLYDLHALGMEFDHIICSEVLEHIRDHERVCENFYKVLRPGGTLHLCCPNSEHPDNQKHELDPDEKGGHVRPGYTEQSYRELLEPIGFRVSRPVGIGGPVRQTLNKLILRCESLFGLPGGIICFGIVLPLLIFETRKLSILILFT